MATRSVDILVRAKNEASGPLKQVQQSVMSVKSVIAAAGLGVGIHQLFGFGADSLRAFAEAEEATAKMEAVLKATGHAAGLAASDLRKFAEARGAATATDDDDLIQAATRLLTFRNIQADVFREGLSLAQDMANTLKTDLNSAVMQVGKALNDPVKGISALSRAGVTFNSEQTKMIERFMATNQIAEAQKIVLAELREEVGGVSEALANTTSGQLKAFTVAMGDAKEAIGALLAPTMKELASNLRQLPDDLNEVSSSFSALAKDFGASQSVLEEWGKSFQSAVYHPVLSGRYLFAEFAESMAGINEALTGGMKTDFFGMQRSALQQMRDEIATQLYGGGESGGGGNFGTDALAKSFKTTVTDALDTALSRAEPVAKTRFGEWLGKIADDLRIRPQQILADRLAEVFNAAWGGIQNIGENLAAPFKNAFNGDGGSADTGSQMQEAVSSPFVKYGFNGGVALGGGGGGAGAVNNPQNEVKVAIERAAEKQAVRDDRLIETIRNLGDVLNKSNSTPELELRSW